jgi:hypothetical protein
MLANAKSVYARVGSDALACPLQESDFLWTIASAWHCWRKRRESGGNEVRECFRA